MDMTASSSSSASASSSYDESSASSDPYIPARIRVRYSESTPDKHPPIYAYALKVEVLEAKGLDVNLFVFQRISHGAEGDATDEFIQIASPVDIEEIPAHAPDLAHNMPYYREKEVTLWFRCYEDLRLAKEKMDGDFETLSLTRDTLVGDLDITEEKSYGK